MKLTYSTDMLSERKVTSLTDKNGNPYLTDTMDVFVKMTDGGTYYASKTANSAKVSQFAGLNIFRYGYYYYDVRIEDQNFVNEIKVLDDGLKNISKKVKKANYSECFEYFDRKRDMMVGGAPTDIVTQLFGVGLCGWAVTRADKEKRLQKAFTTGLPIITGLGSSLIFSALLYSGGVGLLAGAAVGGVTTLITNYVNKNVFGNKDDDEGETNKDQLAPDNNQKSFQNVKTEVKNA